MIGDEATEAADQQQIQDAIAAANLKARNDDINPEELERYIKERFEHPRDFAAGSDFNEQSGELSALASLLYSTLLVIDTCRERGIPVKSLAAGTSERGAAVAFAQLSDHQSTQIRHDSLSRQGVLARSDPHV